ncbi:MAG: S24 family peptidase [Sphingobium limneticum]
MKTSHDSQLMLGHVGLLQGAPYALKDIVNHDPHISTYRCAFQTEKHIRMGLPSGNRRSMTPDQKRDILRKAVKDRGTNIQQWAKAAGVNKNSLYNFLNGHSDGLDHMTYAKLARVYGVPVWKLTGEAPEPEQPEAIWVAGHVQAGAFREAIEWERGDWYQVDVPVPPRFRRLAKALEVRGTSMDKEYREGAIVIWVPMLDARPPRDGDHVIVYSYATDGMVEATVKLLREHDGRRWLWPQSHDPEHQSPIDLSKPGDGVSHIEVVGLVVGDYRSRII